MLYLSFLFEGVRVFKDKRPKQKVQHGLLLYIIIQTDRVASLAIPTNNNRGCCFLIQALFPEGYPFFSLSFH